MVASNAKRGDPSHRPPSLTDYLRDVRVIQAVAQIIFVILLVGLLVIIWTSILNSLQEKNLSPTFDFLDRRAGFAIAEAPDWFTTDATYGQALKVGVINTLRVVSLGLVSATVLGALLGIFLLSNNWLIRTLSRAYVEVLRNTPLLVQLIFWYFVVMTSLPADDFTLPNEGIMFLPWRYPLYLVFFVVLWFYGRRASYPQRITFGALTAIIVMEGSYALWGYSNDAALLFAVLGVVLLILTWFVPQEWKGLLNTVAIIPLGQVIAHVALYIFFLFDIIGHPQAYISEVFPSAFIGVKGFLFPALFTTGHFAEWMVFVGLGFILATAIWLYSGHVTETTGKPIARGWYAIGSIVGFAIIGWLIIGTLPPPTSTVVEGEDGQAIILDVPTALAEGTLTLEERQEFSPQPLFVELPKKNRFGRAEVGMQVSLEYMALLLGLVIYTSAFIGEIVRAGIQAVPYGQIEAARALGLSTGQTLMRIVLPQALRVIIPPMGNQYLNLSKNSSLATAIAFSDTYAVGITTMNQSGQSVPGFALVLLVYLTLSLIISLFMNFMNSRFQLVTR